MTPIRIRAALSAALVAAVVSSLLVSGLGAPAHAAGRTFYFHSSLTRAGQVDTFAGASTFDETPPKESNPGVTVHPVVLNALFDGTISEPITSLTLDAYMLGFFDSVGGFADWDMSIQVTKDGVETDYGLSPAQEDVTRQGPVAHYMHTWTTMAAPDGPDPDTEDDQVPLSIDPREGEVRVILHPTDVSALFAYDSTEYPSSFTINEPAPDPSPTATPTSDPTTPPDPATTPTYSNFAAPAPVGRSAGEPSIGVNPSTGNVMFQANTETLRVNHFNDLTGDATWINTAPPLTSLLSLDPILYTDQHTGRTFVSQLMGACSLMAYTDDDGDSWTQNPIGCGLANFVDHQTVGGGPFVPGAPHVGLEGDGSYADAVYYCSQGTVKAHCSTSYDGGDTFGPGMTVYTLPECRGLHGHIKTAPDGTAYLPHGGCGVLQGGYQAVFSSKDNGVSWTEHVVPGSTTAFESDPSVALGSEGSVYFGWQQEAADGTRPYVGVSHDEGANWDHIQDVGKTFGIKNIQFPTMIAGDDDRAAFAFLGTTTAGDDQAADFPGVWDLYIATTYDSGEHWTTVDATPDDPVQRGCIWLAGGDNACRNLLDFNDLTVDAKGRVLAAYADGCVGACVDGSSDKSQVATIARQATGLGLYSQFDGQIVPSDGDGGPPPPDPNADARTTHYYFHGFVGEHTVDEFGDIFIPGGIRFDEKPPTGAKPAIAPDLPTDGGQVTIWDPHWKGTLIGHVRDLTVDFWMQPTVEAAQDVSHLKVKLWYGPNKAIELPQFTVPNNTPGPVEVKHTFTTMLDAEGNEIPLDVPGSNEEFSINITGRTEVVDAPVILFDSVDYPSGFSVNTEQETTPSPTSSPSATPTPATTTVAFTDGSASSAQYSDDATIAARLVDDQGAAISGADLIFELTGSDGSREWTATTDDDGVASKNVTFTDEPGAYQLSVRYAGRDNDYASSADQMIFVVEKDASATALSLTGKSKDARLASVTTDADSGAGLRGETIEFFADGVSLGTATTDVSGSASVALPAKYRGGHHVYEAVFSGNRHYDRSADKKQT